ncbi:hypothetical protein KOI40_12700 [Aestuariicella sp. G3-2]|uniref:hypothetical protein n=1 Tax=Pseudomaricurvus albidus TaxID=2842452 RepID=UPI001C0E58AC|nr:hypothetical protein [Aestuariicella albida]MBU3070684.1 hypothetical protein [Aestuariicella albida]
MNNISMKANVPAVMVGFTLLIASLLAWGQQTASDYESQPPILSVGGSSKVLLALSNDHQLYFKSYSDYDDLDFDGTVETTYTHSIDYVGYFDPYKCYTYNNARFEPVSESSSKYCSGNWSGNFLNWASMTRIDQIRKVLYGGFRRVDTDSLTVLERTFLTNDAHSFAKYYDGNDIARLTPYTPANLGLGTQSSGLTFCNTTVVSSGESQKIDANVHPPLLRVVRGNYSLWASGERFQCRFRDEITNSTYGLNKNTADLSGINAYSDSPSKATAQVADLNVRVSVCVNGLEEDNCKAYPTSTHQKPVGVLQKFGDEEEIEFGLLTGSYTKNKSGGVLRKNVSSFTDEVNVTTDGTFKSTPANGGIVNTLNKFRLARYRFGPGADTDGRYNDDDSCPWGQSEFDNGKCTNWGNPFSEIMLECYRYFAGKDASPEYNTSDADIISGLTTATWNDPVNSDSACSELSIIAFNASTSSYDTDQLDRVTDLQTTETAAALTNKVGDLEGITGNDYFVGEVVGGETNQLCTAKTVSGLGAVKGTCPDAPRLEGGYHSAGIAYHVYQTDIRPDLPGTQGVNTYAVSLAPSVPVMEVPVPSSDSVVTILPACRNATTNPNTNCALVDFKIISLPEEVSGTVTAKYYVNWEDSEQGGDFDQDMHGVIDVSVTSTKVIVKTTIIGVSTPDTMQFGYVISGTDMDGYHAHSGTSGQVISNSPSSQEYDISASTASLLKDPLFYTAKYGKFNDIDGDGVPDSNDEWDVKNVSGELVSGGDGLPDNYFPVTNPLQLEASLDAVFNEIGINVVSSSAAAVVANTGSGSGAIYQSSYYPKYQASATDYISWPGMLHALFRDENGYFREDTDGDKTLDGYATDYRVEFFYDQSEQQTKVNRYSSANGGDTFTLVDTIDFEDFVAIWNARDELAKLSNAQARTQRTYTSSANTGRFIKTGIDVDGDGTVQPDEVVDFDTSALDPDVNQLYRYFGLKSTNKDEVDNIVNYIRGDDSISGYRTRSVDFDSDGAEEVWRIGDLIHSAPASVSSPGASFDSLYNDDTYTQYRIDYRNRRQVIYVGGNDGMLHAFNAGFYRSSDNSFQTQSSAGSETAHPLGAELWSYVPMAVLPHLQWLTSPDYSHVYYVDGSARVYDVNIFPDDDDHTNGWGTILVVGMRFGGGDFEIDPNSDETGPDADNDNVTIRSSYLIFDITNPETEPRLLAELQAPPADLMSLSLTEGGDSYTSPPTVTVSGDGVGAEAVATLAPTGSLLSLTIESGGKGYSVGDSLSISGDGAGASVVVTSVGAGGEITGVSINDTGSGYTQLSVTAEQSDSEATFSYSLGNGSNSDKLKALNVIDGGVGYSVGDVIAFSGDGSGASASVATVDASGAITSVTIDNEGSGYSSISIDSVTRSDTSFTAVISATLGYSVASVDIVDQGAGYTSATVDIESSTGTSATASVSFDSITWGFTTSKPVVVKRRTPGDTGSYSNPGDNDWYLVFASGPKGPDALSNAVSNDTGRLLFYDLNDMEFIASVPFDSNSFGGDLATIDWDGDYQDDAVYFGAVQDNAGTQSGALKRLDLSFSPISGSSMTNLINTNNPVVETPRLERDSFQNKWIYAGTGRYLVPDDNTTTQTQYYYGIIEPDPAAGVSVNNMVDVTDIQVFTEDATSFTTVNSVRSCEAPCADGGSDVVVNGVTVGTWQELRTEILKTEGWYRELTLSPTNSGAARQVGASNLVGTTLLFSEYAPSMDQCSPIGYSRINAYHFQTGTASPYAPVGVNTNYTHNDGDLVLTDTGINQGLALLGGDGQGVSDDAQGSGVSVDDKSVLSDPNLQGEPAAYGRQSWREVKVDWDGDF